MKGYKMFDADWQCQGFQYEVGKTYEMDGKIELCRRGFHFCEKLEDCFNYYEAVTWNHIAEVEALGEVIRATDDSKCVTNKIRIVREIPLEEFKEIIKDGVARSYGVAGSYGVARSNGVAGSDGVAGSYGVAESYGVAGSYGIINSFGVDHALFLANKPRTYTIFGKETTEERFNQVWNTFHEKLNGWKPTFNNLKSLYLKYGSDWKRTPIPRAEEISKEEAWKDMPKEAVEYVKSLPEYDADMFFEITGIGG